MTIEAKARELISADGIKLGNYHYNIDRYENDEGVFVSLTRWYEECKDCPLYEEGDCDMENPPNLYIYPCSNMLPVVPYSNIYDFESDFSFEDYPEFNEAEQYAIKLIFENKI